MSFVARFFLLVLFLGFAELYLLIRVATQIGFFGTAALCILTGIVGGAMVRYQGLATLGHIGRQLGAGTPPAREIVSGLVLLIVGTMLLTPGFITDVAGFTLLVPRVRHVTADWLLERFHGRIKTVHFAGDPRSSSSPEGADGPRIIDIDPSQ